MEAIKNILLILTALGIAYVLFRLVFIAIFESWFSVKNRHNKLNKRNKNDGGKLDG